MSNNFNFFQVVTVGSQNDEISLFQQADQQNLMDLYSFQEDKEQGFTIQKEYSIFDIQQFLALNEGDKQQNQHNRNQLFPQTLPPKNNGELVISKKKKRSTKKMQNSPFHNYQKHLANAIKAMVIVSELKDDDGAEYKEAARCIWNKYCAMEIKTKRVLHFIFNERNQHAINEPQLKTYGLLEIYRHYGEDVINKAKDYLSQLAIDQIDEVNIEGYLKTRKIKRVEGLKTYILNFKHELERGCLKRRINRKQTP